MAATEALAERWSRVTAPLAAAAAAVAATAYLAEVDPNRPGHYPLCPFRYVTGYACPGCGSLRAVHDLATGQPLAALHRNPLTVVVVPYAVVMWLLWFRRTATGRGRPWFPPVWLLWTVVGVLGAFWVLRNMPGFAFLGP